VREGTAAAVDGSPFYKNQFVITRAEACAAAAMKDAATARSDEAAERGPAAMRLSAQPKS
jgi:hypothetical protein